MLPDMLFKDVGLDALKLLEEHETPESRRLEYKQELPLNDKPQKREFCADVSAFANADGGYLLVGIKDAKKDDDSRPKVVGIPKCEDTADYITRLDSIIKSGVEPNIHDINIKAIDLDETDESRIVLVIFIPQSWTKPHWVGTEKSRAFCSRKSNGKYYLDIYEVRQMFLLSETAADRIREFRKNCIASIQAGATPITVWTGRPTLVLHVVPFSTGSTRQQYDISRIAAGRKYNFDGIYVGMKQRTYLQVYRDGSIEFVLNIPIQGEKVIPASEIEELIWMHFLPFVRESYRKMEVFPPTFFLISLTNFLGYKLVMTGQDMKRFIDAKQTTPRESIPIDRDQLLVPEVIVYEADLNPDQQMKHLRPAMDAIWQSSGLEGSVNYDEESGEWLRPER